MDNRGFPARSEVGDPIARADEVEVRALALAHELLGAAEHVLERPVTLATERCRLVEAQHGAPVGPAHGEQIGLREEDLVRLLVHKALHLARERVAPIGELVEAKIGRVGERDRLIEARLGRVGTRRRVIA
jgi:hypothetical protein